jgi:asparagine synthetase B (glutamine-hydrolysing)
MDGIDSEILVKPTNRRVSQQACITMMRESIEQRESPRDFVNIGRQILRERMSIDLKKKLANKMAEEHVVQEEILKDAKVNFKDDCNRYHKYIEDLEEKTQIIKLQRSQVNSVNQ